MASTLPPLLQASSGALGAALANVASYPLDTITTRIQTASRPKSRKRNSKDSLVSAGRALYETEGWTGFFRGIGADTVSTAISNFLYFYVYSFLRNTLIARRLKLNPPPSFNNSKTKPSAIPVLSAVEEIVIGMLSGVVAKAITSPLSNITVRQQTSTAKKIVPSSEKSGSNAASKTRDEESSDEEEDDYAAAPGVLDIVRDIYEEKGWTGFWSGFSSSIVLTTNPAITSFLVDAFQRALIPVRHLEHPTPAQVFLTSAFASSVASIITYPMILAKSRLMFKSSSGKRLYKSNLDVFQKTIRRFGVFGLYAGLSGQLAKGFFSEGVKMTLKARLELIIISLHRVLTKQRRLAQA
ncbi:hypothetical protein P7C70_g2034, partial [Phenoliferia sp. Uapishka_3]